MRSTSVPRKCAAVTIVALVAAVTVLAGQAAAVKTLSGSVGPGFTISVERGGKKVRSVSAGTYRIRVRDRSDIHNFHIRGPGVNRVITSVDFEGVKSRTMRLRKGTYRYVCDPHSDDMKGSFKVR